MSEMSGWFEKDLNFDRWLVIAVLTLAFIGLVMVYSTGAVLAVDKYKDPYYFLKRESIYLFLGLCLMVFFMYLDHNRLRIFTSPLVFVSLLLLGMVFFFPSVRGAHRWLKFGFFQFQPSELAKLSLVLYLSHSLAKRQDKLRDLPKGFLPYLGIIALVAGLVLIEPDYGGALTITLLGFILLYVAGAKIWHLLFTSISGLVLGLSLLMSDKERWERIISFRDPWKYRLDEAYQLIQSFLAFGSGGLTGTGLGMSHLKMYFLPDAHTDFILSVIGEETGWLGVLFIIALFTVLLTRGIWVSLYAPSSYSSYLAMGLTMLMVMPAVINMGVVSGLLPTKGLVLPFLSYGGSSLLINMAGAGILLNISAQRFQK